MTHESVIRNMTRPEVDELVAWAAREGWNPGLHDAELFWATDPDAFITSYQGEFGFMGFFIVRPEFRAQGHVASGCRLPSWESDCGRAHTSRPITVLANVMGLGAD